MAPACIGLCRWARLFCLFLFLSVTGAPADEPFPWGAAEQTADLGGITLQIFTYRPPKCRAASLLLVFHGSSRNADTYRDDARPLADKLCAIVVAPLFDQQRFPVWRYQRCGLTDGRTLRPAEQRTGRIVLALVEWARRVEQAPTLGYSVIGHSAGAAFTSCFAAFTRNDASRIVIANAPALVVPSAGVDLPAGFGRLPAEDDAEQAIRHYLAEPITLLLGEQDRLSEARGHAVFQAAEAEARDHGWPFNWRLLTVPGVGHDAKAMFASDQAITALQPAQ